MQDSEDGELTSDSFAPKVTASVQQHQHQQQQHQQQFSDLMTSTSSSVASSQPPQPSPDSVSMQIETSSSPSSSSSVSSSSSAAAATAGSEPSGPFGKKTELNRLWQQLQSDPSSFDTWIRLVDDVQRTDNLEYIRTAHRALLREYPLCYGYWQKWSEHERRHHQAAASQQVLEEALQVAGHQVELWTFCLNRELSSSTSSATGNSTTGITDPEMTERVRRLFERAVSAVGLDWRSSTPIWLKYIDFELQQSEHIRAMALFRRALAVPTADLGTVYQRCKEFIESRDLTEILRPDEIAELGGGAGADSQGGGSDGAVLRQRLTASIDRLYQQSYDAYQKRHQLEFALHRTFFHVQPVEAAELTAWSKYLTLEEEEEEVEKISPAPSSSSSTSSTSASAATSELPSHFARVVKLYERSLIVCALYPAFWQRYAQFFERHAMVERAREVYVRGTSTFCKYSPDLWLSFASFEEAHGHADRARELYTYFNQSLTRSQGGAMLLECVLAQLNFERRQGQREKCEELLNETWQAFTSASQPSAAALSFLALYWARLHALTWKQPQRARDVLEHALMNSAAASDVSLWLGHALLESQQVNDDEEVVIQRVCAVCERALSGAVNPDSSSSPSSSSSSSSSPLSNEDRARIYDFYADFLTSRSTSVAALRRLQDRYGFLAGLGAHGAATQAPTTLSSALTTSTKKRSATASVLEDESRPSKSGRTSTAETPAAATTAVAPASPAPSAVSQQQQQQQQQQAYNDYYQQQYAGYYDQSGAAAQAQAQDPYYGAYAGYGYPPQQAGGAYPGYGY